MSGSMGSGVNRSRGEVTSILVLKVWTSLKAHLHDPTVLIGHCWTIIFLVLRWQC